MKKKYNKIKIFILIISFIMILISSISLMIHINAKPSSKIIEECSIETKKYKDRNIHIISPKDNKESNLIILYIHGGAYFGELVKDHWEFVYDIVKTTKATIIVPDYPLAPANTYKEVFQFMEPIYKHILNQKDNKKFILMGDSAGGGLSLALAQKMGEENIEQPNQLILLSPWLDVRLENPKIEEVEPYDKQLNRITLRLAGLAYAGIDGIDTYFVNPIDGPLEKLKNVTIYTGTYDILNPDVHVLIQKAEEQGININLKQTEGAKHVWMLERHKNTYMAEEAYTEIIQQIKEEIDNE